MNGFKSLQKYLFLKNIKISIGFFQIYKKAILYKKARKKIKITKKLSVDRLNLCFQQHIAKVSCLKKNLGSIFDIFNF